MKTTLKRGIGRTTGANGNGNAVVPPAIFSPVTRYSQPPHHPTGLARAGRWFLGFAFIFTLLCVGAAGGAYLYYHESVGQITNSKDVRLAAKNLDIPDANQPAIALVVGYDKRHGDVEPGRSDTMMLIRADPITKSISMLSFPRDLRTTIWCNDTIRTTDRINVAYALCGARGALDTVKHLTGLPINYLMTVDFGGFIEIVNKVDGVWVDVDRRYYNKNVGTEGTNYANINMKPGYQRLTGRRALAYVRYRHTDSDLYRIARQQQFVKALKQQVHDHFSAVTILKLVGAITKSVDIGSAGGQSLEKDIVRYAFFAYGLPSGHFFQSKIENLEGINELTASTESITAAVQEFETPDVEAPSKAADSALGRKPSRSTAPAPRNTTVNVLNGNGITGSAANAAYELGRHGFQIIVPPNEADRNAPRFDYFHTKVYYDPAQSGAKQAGQKIADLFGDAEVARLTADLVPKTQGAMVTVVVGSTFHGTIAPAPVDKTPQKQPPDVRKDPAQSTSWLKTVRHKIDFHLMVPTVLESSSYIDREMPVRAYSLKKGERAVRLTFLSGNNLAGYWGIEETTWKDAPVLQQPNFTRKIKGRDYAFYYSGPHLHMVVLRTPEASYWVVNTLLDSLSNETMIAIAKGLKTLR
jgi:LCP family protein required for cell wall assembly